MFAVNDETKWSRVLRDTSKDGTPLCCVPDYERLAEFPQSDFGFPSCFGFRISDFSVGRVILTLGEIMVTIICDRCGQPMDKGPLRYIAKIQVFAAYDPLEISFDDLTKDTRAEIQKLLRQMDGKSEEELTKEVFATFEFDLCPKCQREYVKEPLPSVA
jgi:hypothetical protein